MNEIINYFETIPSLHRALILAGGITFFWLIETLKPLFFLKYSKWKHAGINIFFTVTTIIVNFLMAFILLRTSQWSVQNNIGILPHLGAINPWIYMIIGLLLLDLIGAYLVHFVEHKVKFLWRFHLIHHSDTWVDTTTANRHHPGESVVRFIFTRTTLFSCFFIFVSKNCSFRLFIISFFISNSSAASSTIKIRPIVPRTGTRLSKKSKFEYPLDQYLIRRRLLQPLISYQS